MNMDNKYERKLLDKQKDTRDNTLWIGMATKKPKQISEVSYRMKVSERDNLKLEREGWK
jgi:hypothetical protein